MKRLIWMAVLTASAGVVGCGDGGDADSLRGEVKVAGSSTVYPITAAMYEEFRKVHPHVDIPITSTGTGGGFKNFFIPGKTDINNASRPIKDSEREAAMENGIEPIELIVGIDALSFVVNKDTDWVDQLTFEQLQQIWGPGDPPTNWNQVDPSWPDAPFELYGPAPTSGTFDYFTEEVIGEAGSHRSDYFKTEHDNVIVQGIEGNPHALGYFGFAYYVSNQNRIKALAISRDGGEAVLPSLENARSGAYPLSRPLFIYVSRRSLEQPHVKAFVEFYIRMAATDLVSEVGYVPITEEQMKANLAKIGVEE